MFVFKIIISRKNIKHISSAMQLTTNGVMRSYYFYRDYAVTRCLSVCLPVTRRYTVETVIQSSTFFTTG